MATEYSHVAALASPQAAGERWGLVAVLLLGLLVCPVAPVAAGKGDNYLGMSRLKPVPEGAKVTLETDRQEYLLGENILVHFVLENAGTQPFDADFGGDYRGSSRAIRFQVTATDEAGKDAEDPDPNQLCYGGRGGPRELP